MAEQASTAPGSATAVHLAETVSNEAATTVHVAETVSNEAATTVHVAETDSDSGDEAAVADMAETDNDSGDEATAAETDNDSEDEATAASDYSSSDDGIPDPHAAWLQTPTTIVPGPELPGDYSAADIDKVNSILQSLGFPEEIVLSILDFGMVWEKDESVSERRAQVDEGTERVPYVSVAVRKRNKLRMVVFRMVSMDQGWSWDRAYHGSYQHSWTWFEAGTSGADGTARSVEPRAVQRNVHASSEFREHSVVWEEGDLELGEWFAGLEEGDWIELFAMARFGGWTNNVVSASVGVYYSL